MVDEIDEGKIMLKYNVSASDATIIKGLAERRGMSLSKANMAVSMARHDAKTHNIPLGEAVVRVVRDLDFNKLITNKKNIPGDRHDTTYIKKHFGDKLESLPSGKKQFKSDEDGKITGFRVTPAGKRTFTNLIGGKPGWEKTEAHPISHKKNIPVYSVRKSLGEIPSPRQLPRPKFYYFDRQGLFMERGHDTPPINDPHFKAGGGKFVPFIVAAVTYQRQASKYPVIMYNEDTITGKKTTPVINSRGEAVREEDVGKKFIQLDYYAGDNNYLKSIAIETKYPDDVIWRTNKGRDIARYIHDQLNILMNEHSQEYKHYKHEREEDDVKTSDQRLASHYGDEFYHKEKRLQELKERDKNKYTELPGLTTLGLRKKKKGKIIAKRKKIIKRKLTKKPVKRCVCKKRVVRRVKK